MSEFTLRGLCTRLVCFTFLLSLCSFMSAGSMTAQTVAGSQVRKPVPIKRQNASNVLNLNLRDFGAVGDGVADDGPALQQAIDTLAGTGGGTLQVPAGQYVLRTAVVKEFDPDTTVTISGEPSLTTIDVAGNGAGLDLTSEFIIAVGEANDALSLSGLDSLLIRDVAFVGVPEALTDARIVLGLANIRQATIEHCEFYGLASLVSGGALIAAYLTDLKLQQSAFLGCAANSGLTTSLVQNLSWLGIAVTDCKFIDYGNRPGFYSKTPLQSPYSWISIGNAANPKPTWSRREAIIQNVFLDEGSYFGISARPDLAGPGNIVPFEVYLSRLDVNVNNLASDGVMIYGASKVFIERSHFGWSTNAGFAINLFEVGEALLDRIDCSEDATRIHVEAQRLALINSNYVSLDSTAPFTRVITTDTPEEDPAQYVRQQYLGTLEHDPDAAGHYYWTDQIIRCDGDAVCATQTQTALAVFLSVAPAARFAVAGQVVDENGIPIPEVTVSVSGSQSVAMETDSYGNFGFSNLATAGSYVITATKTHYSFESQSLVTSTSDKVINFSGTLARHAISGRVFSNTGRPLADATVTLSGARDETTFTAADGNYTFIDLAAGSDYVVTASRDNYVFGASRSFTNLSADEYAVFEGAPLRFTVSGKITKSDGTPFSGVSMSLLGTETGVVMTGDNGDYSFNLDAEGSYAITPSESHYTFSPLRITFDGLTTDQVNDFTGSLNHHTIGGRVFANTGRALAGATVALSGSEEDTTISDADGNYSFANLAAGGNYTVTVSRNNYVFSLSSRSFPDLTADQYAVFEGVPRNYTIAGELSSANGTALGGALVTLSGGLGAATTTNAQGHYSFTVHGEDDYRINVALLNYTFSPASKSFTNVSADEEADFTGTLVDFVISGQFTNTEGTNLSGVMLTVASETGLATTEYDGDYSLPLPAAADYTITPSKANYTFSPQSITIDNLSGNQLYNFTAQLNPGVPVIMSGSDPTRAIAIDSVLRTPEPFRLNYDYPWAADRRTRVMLFATHFELTTGEGAGNLTATAEDASHRVYPLTVEYAAKVEGYSGLTCIVVRLNDDLTDVGDVQVRITYHGLTSEPLLFGIGHVARASRP